MDAPIVWQVDENQRGTWRDSPTNLNVLVEQAYKDKRDGVLYLWPPLGGPVQTEYSIDFSAMQQTNKATDFRRRVRRAIVVLEEVVHMEVVR